ncbi:hypothetical protein evm_011328 [Chilo suppressalis]|nr:hypothetical protein evm_011328 [Chilo suppressalis]
MFYHIIHRAVIPTLRTVAICSYKHSIISSQILKSASPSPLSRFSFCLIGSHTQSRLFSVQVTPEEMIVNYEEVKKAISNNDILIVDVRQPDEIKEHGKIPNSINIPLGDVTKVLSSMSEKEFEKSYNRSKPAEDSPIIFYCMIGKRSGMAQQNALNLGYKNVKNYLGSWTEWASKVQT